MRFRRLIPCVMAALLVVPTLAAQESTDPPIQLFFQAAQPDKKASEQALEEIGKQWKNGYAAMLVEWIRFLPSGKRRVQPAAIGGGGDAPVGLTTERDIANPDLGDNFRSDRQRFANRRDPRIQTRERIMKFLEKRTGQKFGDDLDRWRRWIWSQPYDPHPQMGVFLANLFGRIDPAFRNFFHPDGRTAIRLDEIEWGGVPVNGIPPLDHPPVIPASEARYLDDDNVVFGFFHNGEARAWPRRILAWHELAYDKVGGLELTVVYCTLCGTVIPYKSEVGGRLVKFATSGLLYRSNKLLFDDITFTLWSSLTGEPVVGRMVGRGVRLVPQPVVTTTWGEWRAMHPDTTVLSLDTGFERDYSEGAAYKEYFSTDDLMFAVPTSDDRLRNKDEVLAMRFPRTDGGDDALAISAAFLKRNRLYQTRFAGRDLVVITSQHGANRVYAASGVRFAQLVDDVHVRDAEGNVWEAREDALVRADQPEQGMPRLPAFRAFWFGWHAQYPETELITG